MNLDVIVLNGGSSSGKSSIAEPLQRQLEGTWIVVGVDDLIRALSFGPSDTSAGGSLTFRADGTIAVSEKFRGAEDAWRKGLAAMAEAGTGVIMDEVFLDGGTSQARLARILAGLSVVWVGVGCDPDVAEARELDRGDRVQGMARDQALRVHEGVHYDLAVDTTTGGPEDCAKVIIDHVARHCP